MIPSVNPSLPGYVQPLAYPENPTDDQPSPTTPENTEEPHIEGAELTPGYRTPRLAGLTARFYKHRRSTSLSSYDTRVFMRGRRLNELMDGAKKEGPPFHSRNRGKAEPAHVRASLREGAEVCMVIYACPGIVNLYGYVCIPMHNILVPPVKIYKL